MAATLTVQKGLTYINLKDYCKIDGISDDSTNFTNAYAIAAAQGMGLFHPGGTLVKGNDTLVSTVPIVGIPGVSIIKLKNGANTDLFNGQTNLINFSAAKQTGVNGTLHHFGFIGITLDGNKGNQTTGGWGIRCYAYAYLLRDIVIRNCYSGGIQSDWNGPGPNLAGGSIDNYESRWENVVIHDCGGEQISFSGPLDSRWANVSAYNIDGTSHSHLLHIAPNAPGIQLSIGHFYGAYGGSTVCGLIESGYCELIDCDFESTDFYCLVLLQQSTRFHGHCYASTGGGIKLGQNSGETPISGQTLQAAGVTTYSAITNSSIDVIFDAITGANGCFKFPSGGAALQNALKARSAQASGTLYSGYLDPTNSVDFRITGNTQDGTVAKGGQTRIDVNSTSAFVVSDNSYNDIFNVDTKNKNFHTVNNAALIMYSDAYITPVLRMNNTQKGEITLGNSGSLFSGSGVPSNSIGVNGDYYFRTDTPAMALQRIYVKSAGAWVGII